MNKFADDTKCGHIIKDESDRATLQRCLDGLVGWAEKWGMEFNVNKCKVMRVGRSELPLHYTMNGSELTRVK